MIFIKNFILWITWSSLNLMNCSDETLSLLNQINRKIKQQNKMKWFECDYLDFLRSGSHFVIILFGVWFFFYCGSLFFPRLLQNDSSNSTTGRNTSKLLLAIYWNLRFLNTFKFIRGFETNTIRDTHMIISNFLIFFFLIHPYTCVIQTCFCWLITFGYEFLWIRSHLMFSALIWTTTTTTEIPKIIFISLIDWGKNG